MVVKRSQDAAQVAAIEAQFVDEFSGGRVLAMSEFEPDPHLGQAVGAVEKPFLQPRSGGCRSG